MVLTDTYIRHRRSGFSLVEYLVTLTITVLIIAAGAAASENFLRAVAFLTNSVDLDAKNRLAIDRMSREIRGCDAEYHPQTRELVRDHPDTGTEVYLKGCDSVRFDLFRRNPLGARYDDFPVATTTNCKIVQIRWVCSRRLLGFKANTGRMESARVVIRNQQD